MYSGAGCTGRGDSEEGIRAHSQVSELKQLGEGQCGDALGSRTVAAWAPPVWSPWRLSPGLSPWPKCLPFVFPALLLNCSMAL